MDSPAERLGLLSSHVRPGNPDFLDLPWALPFAEWAGACSRIENMPRGLSRHPVEFVGYNGQVFALKSLRPGEAEREYRALRQMESLRLPAVTPVGHVTVRTPQGEASVLCTRYLEHSLPYHALFLRSGLERYREHLLDAMAGLLVQLHLAGVYWGDCSLFNTLFLRDAGRLSAVLVDAETSEIHPSISDGMRHSELDVMEENVAGALADLIALGAIPGDTPTFQTGADVRRRYEDLWREIRREEVLCVSDRWRIEERIRALNALGFSVGEIELQSTNGGDHLRMRVFVSDRSFHRDLLHSLTGLDVQEQQARQMMNEIQQLRATLSESRRRSIALSGAAWHWLQHRFEPLAAELEPTREPDEEPAELYCRLLEHKWYLSEHAAGDVGHEAAAKDFVSRFGARPHGSTPSA